MDGSVEELTRWVIDAKAGDPEAYGAIVRRVQDMAVAYAYAILGDFHLAQDAAQEAFLEAFCRRRPFSPGSARSSTSGATVRSGAGASPRCRWMRQ
jgi:DNA-directed RNA polymerase specialized sigma24 family protein